MYMYRWGNGVSVFIDIQVYRYLLPWLQMYLGKLTLMLFSNIDGVLADVRAQLQCLT